MSGQVEIRACTRGDEAALALVGGATFLETFAGILGGQDIITHCARAHAPGLYRSWLAEPGNALWLAELSPDRAPIGFMVVAPAQLPVPVIKGDLEIKRIYLLSRFQGGGLGRRLVSVAIDHARAAQAPRLLLGVHAGNHAAIGFYERMGFAKIGERQFNVGGKGYDDNIMALSLQA